jgi:hypothetical protein
MNRAVKYRRNATDCFAMAQQFPDPLSKAGMLAMSQSWLVLAEVAQSRMPVTWARKLPPAEQL